MHSHVVPINQSKNAIRLFSGIVINITHCMGATLLQSSNVQLVTQNITFSSSVILY